MAKREAKTLCVRVPMETAKALASLHRDVGMTPSEAVRRALRAYLECRAAKFVQPGESIRILKKGGGR